MGLFEHWPYTNFHNLNLDWIIKKLPEVFTASAQAKESAETAISAKDDAVAAKEDAQSSAGNAALSEENAERYAGSAQDYAEHIADPVSGLVTTWLDDNITPTTPPVDSSLTVQGAAADAKAAGDRITDLERVVSGVEATLPDWEQGSFNTATGEPIEGSSYIRNNTEMGIPVGVVSLHCDAGYVFLPRAWTTSGTYLGVLQTDNTFSTSGTNYNNRTDFDCSDYPNYIIKIAMRYDPTASGITPSDGEHFTVLRTTDASLSMAGKPADAKATGERIENVKTHSVMCNIERGSTFSDYGATGNGYDYMNIYRRTDMLLRIGDSDVSIKFNDDDVSGVSSLGIYKYGYDNGVLKLIARDAGVPVVNGSCVCHPTAGALYIRLSFQVESGYENHDYKPVLFESAGNIYLCSNPNVPEYAADQLIRLLYKTNTTDHTSGQMLLPPNYSVEGKPVPLMVYCHGTGGMPTWGATMTTLDNIDLSSQFNYWKNEGFAVFDCYPWTTKYYSSSRQISPFIIAPNIMAYVEGIKYVCSHYNVDINNVFVCGLSLGGQMAKWFAHQTMVPIKAVALMAPSSLWVSLRFKEYFLEENARSLMARILGLSNEVNVNQFITTNDGTDNSTVRTFVSDHLDSFAGLAPAALDMTGATYEDMYDYAMTGVSALPQWMVDENLPAIPSAYVGKVPAIVEHPDFCSYAPVPIKIWQAFDDVNVSAHANYTVYKWLKNGGTKVYWRTLANGHGGHGATGYASNAEKQNVTTRLGIAMTDVPVAQVEMIDFFYTQMAA